MALNVKLTAAKGAATGIDFDAYVADYFADFAFSGWPYILGGSGSFEGDQIVILDQLEEAPADTKVIVLDGEGIFYEFSAHKVTGTLEQVRFATLGGSYQSDGSFKQDAEGHITGISTAIDISGFSLTEQFHDIVADLMGSSHEGGLADPSIILDAMKKEAHNVRGSSKGDVYVGTKFADTIAGNGGNDELDGDKGNDLISGGAGKDTLSGSAGNDTLNGGAGKDQLSGGTGRDIVVGGAGADTFVFADWKESGAAAAKRDGIEDFSQAQKDKISLVSMDADTVSGGHQEFSFIGAGKFGGEAGELRFATKGADTIVQADVDGDGKADFSVLLTGHIALTAGDFLL